MRLFTSWPCPPCVLLLPAPTHALCSSILSALQSKESPIPLDMLFLLPGIPCPPGELLVLQDSAQTAPPRRLPCPCPTPPLGPQMCAHPLPWACFLHRGPCVPDLLASVHHQTEFLQVQGLSLSLHPPLPPVACPLGTLGGWCAGGWVSADKGGSEAGPVWCEVWWSGPGWVVLSAGWWVWKRVVL